jgi:predicted nucleotidyltransferase component of viral defense system
MDKAYIDAVKLMLHIAPDVFQGTPFALKGGTAINLFVREMPRLSVDLDLVYVHRDKPRQTALEEISTSLQSIAQRLEKAGLSTRKVGNTEMGDTKLLIDQGTTMVKIEVNTVLRGTVHAVTTRSLVRTASEQFMAELSVPVLSDAELYGGKLVAALDRQHPRDLFDIHLLFENEGITEDMVECFVIYLCGHDRPPYEVLDSRDKDIEVIFQDQFEGMANDPVGMDELIAARIRLKKELKERLTANQRKFILSLLRVEPDWSLLKCAHASELPGIQWKLINLRKFQIQRPDAFAEQIRRTEEILEN